MARAIFGAGCFWGVEAAFRARSGVSDVISGYCGGSVENPSYESVCTGSTGHAEVVEVHFDPDKISYDQLLETFWNCHDPTEINRQGPDIGPQYRSAIFCTDDAQLAQATSSKEALDKAGHFPYPIATEIGMAGPFWRAEEYHQRYFEKLGLSPTCHSGL